MNLGFKEFTQNTKVKAKLKKEIVEAKMTMYDSVFEFIVFRKAKDDIFL